MISRLLAWWRQLTCTHRYIEPRFRWNGEWAEYYDECVVCGKEFLE